MNDWAGYGGMPVLLSWAVPDWTAEKLASPSLPRRGRLPPTAQCGLGQAFSKAEEAPAQEAWAI